MIFGFHYNKIVPYIPFKFLKIKVNFEKLEIKNSSNLDAAAQPHIIFILNEASEQLKEIISKFKG